MFAKRKPVGDEKNHTNISKLMSLLEVHFSPVILKLSIERLELNLGTITKDKHYKLSNAQKEELFQYRKSINKKAGGKRVKFARNGQKFSKSTTSKIFVRELEAKKNAESNTEEDEEKIRAYVISLTKNGIPNPINGKANGSESSTTSNVTQETTLRPEFKSIIERPRKQG